MPGPRDPEAAKLLQAPLAYPGIEDQQDVILATGVAEARRPKPKTRGTGGTKPATKAQPKPARTLTEEQQVTADQLITTIVRSPDGDRVPAGQPATVVASVEWKNAAGVLVPWDPAKIHVRYGKQKQDGPNVMVFRPTFEVQTLVIEVDLWSEKAREWRPHRIYSKDVTAYCAADISGLSDEEKHVVATLFGEGGSDAKRVQREEVIRIMWCIENRVRLIGSIHRALATNPKDATALAQRSFVEGRGWGKRPTYTAVLTKNQFDAVNEPEYKKAKDPANAIKNAVECARLQMTIDIALEVMTGIISDPDQGRGNPKAPGCFYYMTKDAFAANKAWNDAHPNVAEKDKRFAPDWPPLPGNPNEKHLFWGIEPKNAFKP